MREPVRLEINFLRKPTGHRTLWLVGTLIAVTCLLTSISTYLYEQKLGLEEQQMEYELLAEEVENQGMQIDQLKYFEQMEAETNTLNSVANMLGKQKFTYSQFLYEVNYLLPAQIVLEEIDIDPEAITMKGNCAEYYSTSQLVAGINASPLMLNARELTTKSITPGQIKFTMVVEHKGQGK